MYRMGKPGLRFRPVRVCAASQGTRKASSKSHKAVKGTGTGLALTVSVGLTLSVTVAPVSVFTNSCTLAAVAEAALGPATPLLTADGGWTGAGAAAGLLPNVCRSENSAAAAANIMSSRAASRYRFASWDTASRRCSDFDSCVTGQGKPRVRHARHTRTFVTPSLLRRHTIVASAGRGGGHLGNRRLQGRHRASHASYRPARQLHLPLNACIQR